MRRVRAAVLLLAGLLATAGCGGDDSTGDVCDRVEADGSVAADRFAGAGQEIGAAVAGQDEAAALAAIGEAESAADELGTVLRDSAGDAADEELAAALDTWADELEALVDRLDAEALMAGEQPDDAAMQAAVDRVDELCARA